MKIERSIELIVIPAKLRGADVPRTSAALSGGQGDLVNGIPARIGHGISPRDPGLRRGDGLWGPS